MEHDSNQKPAMSILSNRMRHICNTPLRWLDSFRLHRDSLLSQGGIRTVGIVFFFGLLVTFLVALGLFLYYGNYFFLNATSTPDYAQGSFKPKNIIDAAYYLLITNGGQNFFEGSHLWGALITSVGIFLIAFLTSALTSLMERRSERYLSGESVYRMKNHIVIFGASDYLYSIIREKTKGRETGFWNKVIAFFHPQRFLIVTTKDVKAVRREVFSYLEKGTNKKDFVFFFGERTSQEDISHLSLEYAREVFIIGDSEESDDYESYRDANNMDCVMEIGKYLDRVAYEVAEVAKDGIVSEKSPKPLLCHVMFEYQTSFAAFQFSEPKVSARLDFRPFNYYDLWAQKMLVTKGEGVYSHKYLDTIFDEEEDKKKDNNPEGEMDERGEEKNNKKYIGRDSKETVHLIILGMSKMGIAMGIQAAHVCHYPNFRIFDKNKTSEALDEERKKADNRTRITFIDTNADIEMNYLKGRFPSLLSETRTRYMDLCGTVSHVGGWKGDEDGWYDTEFEFIKGRIESPQIQDYIEDAAAQTSRIVTIAVCLPKSHQSMAAAMYMRESVYANVLQIFAFQRYSGTIIKELAATEKGRYQKKIVPFGMMECGYDSSLDDDTRAMLVSYVYASFYALNPTSGDIERSTDPTFDRFEHFTDWPSGPERYKVYPDYSYKWPKEKLFEKISSAYNASTIGAKLRGVGIFEEKIKTLTDDKIKMIEETIKNNIILLSNVEHNRWNLEKMLTGYRALNEVEVALMKNLRIKDDKAWEAQRKQFKDWPHRAHLDICSVEELYQREKLSTIEMDNALCIAIPKILEIEKTMKEKQPKKKK